MKHHKNNELATAASPSPARPSSYPGSPKPTMASRSARRTRSATPSVYHPAPSSPKRLPTDPLGSGVSLRGQARSSGSPMPRSRDPPKTIVSVDEDDRREEQERIDSSPSVDLLDSVPMELAKAVVNMHEYYTEGVDELAHSLESVKEELRRAKDENQEMKRRLDMHFVMLRQAADFMHKVVSDGRGSKRASLGTVQEEEGGSSSGLTRDDGDEVMRDMDMEVPPTPVVDREPVRSTGRKASRRREVEKKASARRKGKSAVSRRHAMSHSENEDDAEAEEGTRDDAQDRYEEEEDDDGLKILDGAPRLQALLRRTAWTPINNPLPPPSPAPRRRRQPSPINNNNDPAADYHPSSPPSSPSSASSASSSPSPSLYEDTPTKTNKKSSSSSSSFSSRPRYSAPRHTTTPRFASGPSSRPFRFHRMGRTVLDVWREYKHGTKGNPAIEALELKYGTGWRTGNLREVKYASNYVGVRQKVVSTVEEMCERQGIGAEEACRRLDERVDGRMQMLISAVRRGEDPLKVIPKR